MQGKWDDFYLVEAPYGFVVTDAGGSRIDPVGGGLDHPEILEGYCHGPAREQSQALADRRSRAEPSALGGVDLQMPGGSIVVDHDHHGRDGVDRELPPVIVINMLDVGGEVVHIRPGNGPRDGLDQLLHQDVGHDGKPIGGPGASGG